MNYRAINSGSRLVLPNDLDRGTFRKTIFLIIKILGEIFGASAGKASSALCLALLRMGFQVCQVCQE